MALGLSRQCEQSSLSTSSRPPHPRLVLSSQCRDDHGASRALSERRHVYAPLIASDASSGLGNRCSIQLSYGDVARPIAFDADKVCHFWEWPRRRHASFHRVTGIVRDLHQGVCSLFIAIGSRRRASGESAGTLTRRPGFREVEEWQRTEGGVHLAEALCLGRQPSSQNRQSLTPSPSSQGSGPVRSGHLFGGALKYSIA
jgi:hypothetical protein